jgi:hypothetical protein
VARHRLHRHPIHDVPLLRRPSNRREGEPLSSKLMDESPVLVMPSLAVSLGLNEAIVLQQLHWLLQRDTVRVEKDVRWLKVGPQFWEQQFPWWSEATIRRVFASLRNQHLVLKRQNEWAIDYGRFSDHIDRAADHIDRDSDQNDRALVRREEKEPERPEAATSAADGEQQLFEAPPVKPAPVYSDGQPGDPNQRITEVWEHYVQLFGDRLRVKELTAPRQRMLLKGLTAIAWDVPLGKRAISGLKSYRSSHPDGSQDISLSVVFATGPHSKSNLTDQIEWWAQQAQEAVPTNASVQIPIDLVGVPSVTKGSILARRREVARMYDHAGSAEAKERGEVAVDWLKEHIGHQPKVVDGELRGWELVER